MSRLVTEPPFDEIAHRAQARLRAHRGRTRATQLDPVVLRRVVAGGEHCPGQAQITRGEVEPVGAGESDANHVAPLGADTVGERRDELIPGEPHVLADDDGTGASVLRANAEDLDERCPGPAGEVGIELLGHQPAHVIGLEDLVESRCVPGGGVAG